jgi:hypothetical protein
MNTRRALRLVGAVAAVCLLIPATGAFAQGRGQPKETFCHVPPGNPGAAHVISTGAPAHIEGGHKEPGSSGGGHHTDGSGCGGAAATTPVTTPAAQPGQQGERQKGGPDQEAAGAAQGAAAGADQLAFTGLETLWLALLGAAMLASGLALRARSKSSA